MPLIGTTGAASARGFGFGTLTTFGPVGWILYTGLASSSSAGSAAFQRGFFVDASSNSYWTYSNGGSKTAVVQADTNGLLTANTVPFSSSPGDALYVLGAQSLASGAGNVIVSPGATLETGGVDRLNALLVKQFTVARIGFTSFGTRRVYSDRKPAIVTSGGNVFVTGELDQGKSGMQIFVICLSSSGSFTGMHAGETQNRGALCVTTSGTPVLLLGPSSSAVKWAYLSSTAAFSSGFQCSLSPSVGLVSTLSVQADASNNIFGLTSDGYIFRISSSNSVTHLANVTGSSGPTGDLRSIVVQGSSVYIMWAPDGAQINVMSLNSSNLTHQWTNSFSLSGFSSHYLLAGMSSLYATAGGLFLRWSVDVDGRSFVMKIPLTGMPSAGSKVLSGVGTLDWARPVLTITQYTPGTTSSASLSGWSGPGSSQNTNPYSAVATSNTATAQKTEI